MQIKWAPYILNFSFVAKTSRESMRHKATYFVRITDPNDPNKFGVGECALFRGLSSDDTPDYEQKLSQICLNPCSTSDYSSIRFGIETALINAGIAPAADSPFMRGEDGIPINGLIWMGDRYEMRTRIDEKLANGYKVLKLKIGGIDFDQELELLRYIRSRYSKDVLELRLDANGSFTPSNALDRLNRLSVFNIHSIEQPIHAGQHIYMAELCKATPIPIALDEELIGTRTPQQCEELLDLIKPHYIIIKPALCGGLSGADIWADVAEQRSIGWWATSALESNVGLMSIARWVAGRGISMPQGLGTGMLYTNNINSPLYLKGDRLYFNPENKWIYPELIWRQ